ncbi:MAG: hypothetical protein LLG37_03570, partial [Spirochaetia bacterium]|nr:hypothetical protein [Spirochaetia bacterium]
MKNNNKLVVFFSVLVMFSFSITLTAKSTNSGSKTDYGLNAKIIAVADPAYKEYTYIDIGKAHGIKAGQRFLVKGRYGKVMVEVVQPYQRMSAVRIVDSYLLQEGNGGDSVAESMYPKIKIKKYTETRPMFASRVVAKKKSASSVTPKKKVAAKKAEVPPLDTGIPALPGETGMAPVMEPEAGPDMTMPEPDFGAPGLAEEPIGEAGAGLPGEEVPVMDMGIPAEPGMDMGAGEPALPGDDMGLPADMGMDMGAGESALPGDDMGLPADMGMDMGAGESALPGDDMGLPADMGMDMGAG